MVAFGDRAGGAGEVMGLSVTVTVLAFGEASARRPVAVMDDDTPVGVGIVTGADKVHVTAHREAVERDRLVPMSTARDLANRMFECRGTCLVNPWADDGSLVNLTDYLRLSAYLSAHPGLRERFVAQKSPASWYRTVGKLNPTLRFQAQYLKQIRIPAPESIGAGVAESLRVAFHTRDVEGATRAAAQAYGIGPAEFELLVPAA